LYVPFLQGQFSDANTDTENFYPLLLLGK